MLKTFFFVQQIYKNTEKVFGMCTCTGFELYTLVASTIIDLCLGVRILSPFSHHKMYQTKESMRKFLSEVN
jgi:hypothetical protein